MMKRTLLLSAAALAPMAANGEMCFDEYCRQFGKSYSGAEYDQRRSLFEARVAQHELLNARPSATWTAGVNALTDLLPEEMQSRFGYNKYMREDSSNRAGFATMAVASTLAELEAEPLPKDVDWRKRIPAVVTPVKNQGGCGSCWAFAASQVIESHLAIETGVLMELSPQHLNSCTANPKKCGGLGGCMGATAQLAFNSTIVNGGLASLWDAPYLSGISHQNEECPQWLPHAAQITGYEQLPRNDADALKKAVAKHGPVAVSVDASDWYMYQGGIFDDCNNSAPLVNHAVTLDGYGEEGGIKYWLIRNSWGTSYGEAGYIRLKRYDDEPCGVDTEPLDGFGCEGGPSEVIACGECGVLSDSSYPTGAKLARGWRRLEASTSDVMV